MLSIIYNLLSGLYKMFGLDYFVLGIYCVLIYLYFDSDVLIQFLRFDIYFKFILRGKKPCTLTPSYLGNVCVATVTMSVNSL